MKLQDALFNWLQISIVAEARPEDHAAAETRDFFEVILREDHHLTRFSYTSDNSVYRIQYETAEEHRTQEFDRESAEQLLEDINSNPKYNE
ncbi:MULTISPECIES: hypothetical protein [unclassified Paenibacillus]|uniref:hypothetical protein n=1 Tax=unclassified Paenibacillus TaxID=185978 RepID=UPI001AE5A2FB|nr:MULTISPECIES: hypothetical protein [unclassified Paenibacillus]MBP1156302.1 hypothetical protein [Paenibacillus sp. PvP091]MBP1168312.1 hypothetical protein [Paenibacillus sp. PvR098]MBP2439340.1 hypothetical protein [Paenibacillus sp. PvP052]